MFTDLSVKSGVSDASLTFDSTWMCFNRVKLYYELKQRLWVYRNKVISEVNTRLMLVQRLIWLEFMDFWLDDLLLCVQQIPLKLQSQ